MRLFNRKTNGGQKDSYDPEKMAPAIRCSICTGEQTAGFRDRASGEFHEVCMLRNDADLQTFMRDYGITEEIEKFY